MRDSLTEEQRLEIQVYNWHLEDLRMKEEGMAKEERQVIMASFPENPYTIPNELYTNTSQL